MSHYSCVYHFSLWPEIHRTKIKATIVFQKWNVKENRENRTEKESTEKKNNGKAESKPNK